MPRKKAGRRVLAKVAGAPAPSQTGQDQSIGVYDSTPDSAFRPVGASRERRWTKRPRRTTVLSDAAVWTFYFLLTAAGLFALCALLWIVWPTP